MSRKKSAMLGYDPLAWIKQDEGNSESSVVAVEDDLPEKVDEEDKVSSGSEDQIEEAVSSVSDKEEITEVVDPVQSAAESKELLMENEIVEPEVESESVVVDDRLEDSSVVGQNEKLEEIVINLAESADMAVVCDLYAELGPLLKGSYKQIILNASEVSFIGTSCIQTLAVFLKDAEDLGINVSWQGSSGLCETLDLLNARELLKLSEECT